MLLVPLPFGIGLLESLGQLEVLPRDAMRLGLEAQGLGDRAVHFLREVFVLVGDGAIGGEDDFGGLGADAVEAEVDVDVFWKLLIPELG